MNGHPRVSLNIIKLVCIILSLCFSGSLVASCGGEPSGEVPATRNWKGWDFREPADYSYDPLALEVAEYSARNRMLPLEDGWWTRTQDEGRADMAYGVACDARGDIAVTGVIVPGKDNDIWVRKYSGADGEVLWTRTHASGRGSDKARAVCFDPVGDCFVAGHHSTKNGYDSWVRKFNGEDGATVWTSTYDNGGVDDYAVGLACAPDNGIYACGYTMDGADYDVWVRKFNGADGATTWTRTYDGGNGSDFAYGIAVSDDGRVFITGFMHNGTDNDIWVARLDGDSGETAWERKLEHRGNDMAFAISLGPDGDPVAAGTVADGSRQNIWAGRFRAAGGETVWERVLGTTGVDDYAYGVSHGPDGNPVVAGYKEEGSGERIWLGKLDGASGSALWEMVEDTGARGIAYGVACDSSGDPFVVGYLRDGGGSSILVRKYPPGRYALSTSITTTRGLDLNGDEITGFGEYRGAAGAGTVTYQLSPDGRTFYYHDGGSWVEARDTAGQSNPAGEVNGSIADFNNIARSRLYARAFLKSNSVKRVVLEGIRVDTD